MGEEESRKKEPMSLNQLHNRFLSASNPKNTTKPYHDFPSEMKNGKPAKRYDAPSFNLTGFDSPSPVKEPSMSMSEEELLSAELANDDEIDVSHGEPDVTEFDSSHVKEPSICMSEEELLSAELANDDEIDVSHGEPDITEFDPSHEEDKPVKVKIHGRRRLCKVVSKDDHDEEKQDNFHDAESDFCAAVPQFDTPSHVKSATGSVYNGGGEIRDILSDLSSRFDILSIEKRRRLIEQLPSTSDFVTKEKNNLQKPGDFSAYVGVDMSSSFGDSVNTMKNSCIQNTVCTASRIENVNGEHVKNKLGKVPIEYSIEKNNLQKPGDSSAYVGVDTSSRFGDSVNTMKNSCIQNTVCTASRIEKVNGEHVKNKLGEVPIEYSIGSQKDDKDDGGGDDDDDCMVMSGQNFVQKVESRQRKFKLESDNYEKVHHILGNDSDGSVSGDKSPFTLNNPKYSYTLPSKIAKMLYPHQRDGLKWLWSLHCKGKGGILGDDMGLGKTMQICGFLAGLFHSSLIKRVLVVAPKTLLPHWMKELAVVGLSQMTREYFGTCVKARQYELQYILQDKGVLLTTYDIVRNNVVSLTGDYDEEGEDAMVWDYMILDEGHLIKNPSTQRAKSLLAIPCAHRIIISGTPLQNNLKELWALFNFCCPELLGDKKCFKLKYESAILRGNDKNASDRDKRIGSAVAQDLRQCIQPYFLRRMKSEVFREDDATSTAKLSKKNEIIVWLRLTIVQRQLYEAFLKSEIVLSAFDGSPLAALTILKKICDHPLILTKRAAEDLLEGMESELNEEDHGVAEKLAMHIADVTKRYNFEENHDHLSCKISFITSLLDNLIPDGHNVLIFSQTRKMLNLIQDALIARGYKFLRIDGTTKATDRLKIVNDFQEGIGAPIFLLTSQVGGLGLTLTKADRVIVVDPAWNPSTDNQSVDRAYRIGQKKDVIVYRLMTCGTVEEKIYRKQIYKGGLFKSATEHKEQIRYFSQQDLRELFSLPKHGFDISLTQQQLHEEHDSEHTMDSSLKIHTTFLESLGIAGISHHSLLFSKTAPVPVVQDDELTRIRQSTFVGNSYSCSSHEQDVDAARYAINPKDVVVHRKNFIPKNSSNLTETEIKEQIKRLSNTFANKAMVSKLPDKGEKIQRQIAELKLELDKLSRSQTEIIDLDDIVEGFQGIVNL